jgi:hypothetical protein
MILPVEEMIMFALETEFPSTPPREFRPLETALAAVVLALLAAGALLAKTDPLVVALPLLRAALGTAAFVLAALAAATALMVAGQQATPQRDC